MIKTTDIVREILFSSEAALSALAAGYLNLSAYAVAIKAEVEKKTKKSVKTGTIVVALSRFARSLSKQAPLLPAVEINNIAVKTGLVELAFDKTKANRDRLQRLYQESDFISADFFTVTHGVGELSIVIPENLVKIVQKFYAAQKPKFILNNLASLTVRFDERYIHIPNVTFALVRPLALKKINIVEIVSTYTELTFILYQKDLQEAFITLGAILHQQK